MNWFVGSGTPTTTAPNCWILIGLLTSPVATIFLGGKRAHPRHGSPLTFTR
jgi:hypothetical protein